MPLLWLSLAFLLGLLAGSAWQIGWVAWVGLAVVGIACACRRAPPVGALCGYAAWRRWVRLPLALLLAGFCIGALRSSLAQPRWGAGDLAWYNERGTARLWGWSPPAV